jgi:hypothetical protein
MDGLNGKLESARVDVVRCEGNARRFPLNSEIDWQLRHAREVVSEIERRMKR